jgi:hypothetical protein
MRVRTKSEFVSARTSASISVGVVVFIGMPFMLRCRQSGDGQKMADQHGHQPVNRGEFL